MTVVFTVPCLSNGANPHKLIEGYLTPLLSVCQLAFEDR